MQTAVPARQPPAWRRGRIVATIGLVLAVTACAGVSSPPAAELPTTDAPAAATPSIRPRGAVAEARVTRIIDGDTLEVSLGGNVQRVRLIGIDAPEPDSADPVLASRADRATDALTELVGDRDVILESDVSETDRYGRLLRYVWVESFGGLVNVNVELTRKGWTESKAYEPDTAWQAELDAAAADAKAAGQGR